MKKGLRRDRVLISAGHVGQNIFPDEEGIKTNPMAVPLVPSARTYSLMKKGLRRPTRTLPLIALGQNIFPDEEGIKTTRSTGVEGTNLARTYSLMKKGLRRHAGRFAGHRPPEHIP